MTMLLLPASAKAFAERSGPNVVLAQKAEPWLTQALKRVNKTKRPLNNVTQHTKFLQELLSGPEAVWLLTSLILPNKTAAKRKEVERTISDTGYSMIHVQAYAVHVDMVSRQEVAFKLTQQCIDELIAYHKDIYCVDAAADYGYDWPEKSKQLETMQEDFKQAINRYVFRCGARVLEGLEEEGAGELLEDRSTGVKDAITEMFRELTPPPPRIVNVVGATPYGWWMSQTVYAQQPQYVPQAYHSPPYAYAPIYAPPPPPQHYLQRPPEPWRVLGSTPSPSPSYHSEIHSTPWSQPSSVSSHPAYTEPVQLPSPTPSYRQPHSQPYAQQYTQQYTQPYAQPRHSPPPIELPPYSPPPIDVSSMPAFTTTDPSLLMPSQLVRQHCGTSFNGPSGYSSFFGSAGYDVPITPLQAAF